LKLPRMRLSDVLDDRVAFRNLEPLDQDLRGLRQIRAEIGVAPGAIPRKTSPGYAAAIVHFLRQAQALRGAREPLRRIVFIGDTRMNDGKAATNLCEHLPLRGFIGSDRLEEQPREEVDRFLVIANRWTALEGFVDRVADDGFPIDEGTALLLDLDKTTMGARGRNDGVIDSARVEAVRLVIEETLGETFDELAFRAVYDRLNQVAYHPFTRDNQDYLAYISLMIVGGVCPAEEMWTALHEERLSAFEEFVDLCAGRPERMSPGLAGIHQEVSERLGQGDPTPFKRFRYQEYLSTVSRMDVLPAQAPREEVLASEIVITAEVVDLARSALDRGVLTFGISDKPDEASVPTPQLVEKGYRPLHRISMKVV
jgi:hypothetical protein